MRSRKTLNKTLLSIALASLLAACSNDQPGTETQQDQAKPKVDATAATEDALVAELANSLQGCSYDGSPVKAAINTLTEKVPTDCRDMVEQIMKFTGLPQNFDVVEGNVPNAAAMIVMGKDNLPHRVIAFNPGFMNEVRLATDNNNWAPVSIMAHEIGHHLSGHTITPGGSQPPIELEADKFSGFVLYKMGAQLSDAQKALITLVPEADGPTHPGRGKRVAAIQDGWKQACQQQGGSNCSSGMVAAAPAAQSPTASAPMTSSKPVSPASTTAMPGNNTAIASKPATTATGSRDILPAPSASATPSKFNQFIYDEFGMLDAGVRAKYEKQMYDHAKQWGVEIVTIMVKDLHGLSGDEYAYAMMRQLRVGKLDVGNGAVLVVAPEQGQVGIAMGPGVLLEMKGHLEGKKSALKSFIEYGYQTVCKKKGACGASWTDSFLSSADHIRRDTNDWEWTIRHQSFGAIMAAEAAYDRARKARGEEYDPEKSPSFRTIARMQGTVVNLNAPVGDKKAWVIDSKLERGYKAMHVRSAEGRNLVFYVDPNTEALMPGGKLVTGKSYAFIARISAVVSENPEDSASFDLLSYDQVN